MKSTDNIKKAASEYLKAGLSVIPTQESKNPAVASWTPYQSERLKEDEVEALFSDDKVFGLAIVCGAVSGGLEVVDVDTKYDTTGTLWDDFSGLLRDNLPDVYQSFVIARTKSGGYHIYYRCDTIEGNKKLAKRRDHKVLIETRGAGGYVIAPPTPGYEYIQGSPGNIAVISAEDRTMLFSIAQSLNEQGDQEDQEKKQPAEKYNSPGGGMSPWDDYNQRGDVIGLLEKHGWSVVYSKGERVFLKTRDTENKTSGNYHTGLRVFFVWTTSTEFENRGYSPAQVFTLLECGNDNKKAYRELLELGYGEPYKGIDAKPTRVRTEKIRVEAGTTADREAQVISEPGQMLMIEDIMAVSSNEILISSPGPEAQEEIEKAIDVIQGTKKRVYIREENKDFSIGAYFGQAIIREYVNSENEAGEVDYRDRDKIRQKAIVVRNKLSAGDREDFNNTLQILRRHGFSEPLMDALEEEYAAATRKAKRIQQVDTLLRDALQIEDKDSVVEHLRAGMKQIDASAGIELLPINLDFKTLLEGIAKTPETLKTGYGALDKFAGIKPGAITLIAGRPRHGKTTLMFNMMLEMAQIYNDKTFYFFSYEEPTNNIIVKLLNRLIGYDLKQYFSECEGLASPSNFEFLKHYIRTRRNDIEKVEDGMKRLKELIDGQRIKVIGTNYSVEKLSSVLAYVKSQEDIGAVFIDYIQRMNTEKKTSDTRQQINIISDKVLNIAKDTYLPIILGAQINRAAVTEGKNKEPKLENLKETGNLEEDANTVLSVYNAEIEALEDNEQPASEKAQIKIKALKNREGKVNEYAYLHMYGHTQKITN